MNRQAWREIKAARTRAHDAFDPLWKAPEVLGFPKLCKNRDRARVKMLRVMRRRAYSWLGWRLGLQDLAHIGQLDALGCDQVIEACRDMNARKILDWWRAHAGAEKARTGAVD